MAFQLSRTIEATFPPPVMEARRWIADAEFPPDRPLLNLSQAAPVEPPPEALREELARAIREDATAHTYGPVLGLPELRETMAAQWSGHYGGGIAADQVAITSGCNQAFCAAMSAIAAPGDAVMLPMPWYFNHKMHLDMAGIETVLLPAGPDMVPSVEDAAKLMTDRVRAIALVTPNNPTGAEYPPEMLSAFRDLARSKGVALIVDETYRDFHSAPGAPHALFADPDWDDVLVHLYSFSKVFRLTGHRVGAMIAAPSVLAAAEKYLDTVAICPNRIAERAALFGLQTLGDWVAGERLEILARGEAVRKEFARLDRFDLVSSGAYFAYVRHALPMRSDALAEALVRDQSILVLPGTMFAPPDTPDRLGETTFRAAFANADADGIRTFADRLAAFSA